MAALVIALVLAAVVTGLAVYDAETADPATSDPGAPTPTLLVATGRPPPGADTPVPQVNQGSTALLSIPVTSDPDLFSAAVAHALFDWDTRVPIPVSDHAGRLLVLADPSGQEAAGLAADVAAYLPSPQAWTLLRPYYTRQWIQITSAVVPHSWAQALEEAGPSGLPEGSAAFSIHGVRNRSGVWEGQRVTSTRPVAFTVFVLCAPTSPSCRLLRLSRLDEPLE